MQFCLPGFTSPCSEKGQFFIADQVWIKYNSQNDIIDMVIVDTKLSKTTAFTYGQAKGKNGVGGKLTYKPNDIKTYDALNIRLPEEIKQDDEIPLRAFYKMYGDGRNKFIGIE